MTARLAKAARDALRLAALAGGLAIACLSAATAQPTPQAPPDPASFVRGAHSSAVLQAKAAELAASRETRPEVRAFGQAMVEFRREQLPKLEGAAREHKLAVPSEAEFEHRVILENLEPLDFLALSRRYAEIAVQALEQESRGYAAAEASGEAWLKSLAAQTRPRLEKFLEDARAMQRAVGP